MSDAPRVSLQDDLAVTAPRRVGRYVLCAPIARGGMAEVHLARFSTPQGFHKLVALKTIHPEVAADPGFVKMFTYEARLVARLSHPNVCAVYDFGVDAGVYYLAMEYLLGVSLADVFRRVWQDRGLPATISARIIADAARGLHAAHELRTEEGTPAEVIHRDISPQNLSVLFNGATKVLDFGIAHSLDRTGVLTRTGQIKGKAAYLAPEQIEMVPVDRRVDVWALGVVLWEATVGERLFRRETEAKTIAAVLTDEIPRPSQLVPGYPMELEAVVMRALSREPATRFQTADEMARTLEAYLARQGEPVGESAVAAYVGGLFTKERAEREALLARVAAEAPGPRARALDEVTELDAPARASKEPAGGVSKIGMMGIAAVLIAAGVLAAGGAFVVASRSRGERGSAAPARAREGAPRSAEALGQSVGREVARESGGARERVDGGGGSAGALVAPSGDAGAASVAAHDAGARVVASTSSGAHVARRSAHRASASEATTATATSTASEGGERGYLNLIYGTSVRVFEGARLVGETPLVRRAMPAGRHALRLVDAEGHTVRTVTVTIAPGETTALSVR